MRNSLLLFLSIKLDFHYHFQNFIDDSKNMSPESLREFSKENKWYESEGWDIIGSLLYNKIESMFGDDKVS